MTPRYGFEFVYGGELEVDAGTIAEAIATAEKQSGRRVMRGRLLDGYTPGGAGYAPTWADVKDDPE